MSRSLPLSPDTAPAAPKESGPPPASSALSGKAQVFDPAMCCPTGICGPGVEPSLLQITRDLRWLRAQGVTVERVGLAQEPQAFVANPRVSGLLQAFGDGALPAVLVNDTVLAHGRYPTRQEFVDALAAKPTAPPRKLAMKEASGSCCTPDSGCC